MYPIILQSILVDWDMRGKKSFDYIVNFGFNDTHLGMQKRSLYTMCS